jgi:hypothetical protein
MIKHLGKITLTVLLLSLAAAPLRASAQDMSGTNKPKSKSTNSAAAADAKAKPLPFKGKLGAVDNNAKTITLDESTKRVFMITSETRLTKSGKPATLEDAVVGDDITGSYKKLSDGKLSAVSVNLGGKAATPPVPGKTKKDTNSVPVSTMPK